MAVDEYKALTVVHLPHTEKLYAPGKMIPRSAFEKEAEKVAEVAGSLHASLPEGDKEKASKPLTAKQQIDYFLEWGTISEDPDAEVHPDHRPVDPGQPTIVQLIEQARNLIPQLEERGAKVPKELRELAEIEHTNVVSGDSGSGGDKTA